MGKEILSFFFPTFQKLSLNDDVFEAESDSDWQSETKDDVSPKKKKKKSKDGEDRSPDDLKKKKSKSAKLKEKRRTEFENSSDTLVSDSKPKKRTSETKEDSKDPKKQRKEDTKEIKKKKGDIKELKIKSKEENRKSRKEKHGDVQFDSESSTLDDVFSQGTDNENSDLNSESKDEKQKVLSGEERLEQEIAEKDSIADRHLDGSGSNEDDSIDNKVKRKKKKIQKAEDYREEGRKVETQDTYLEKKSMHKKQKGQEKVKMAPGELEKVSPAPSPVQKGLKLSADERGPKSTDSPGEVSNVRALGWGLGIKSNIFEVWVSLQYGYLSGREKNTNWKVNELDEAKEGATAQCIGETEKFLDSENYKGGKIQERRVSLSVKVGIFPVCTQNEIYCSTKACCHFQLYFPHLQQLPQFDVFLLVQ